MLNLDLLFNYDSTAHNLNIAIHVVFGSAAILLGIVQMLLPKGTALHRAIGRCYNGTFAVVLMTAIAGVAIFEFRAHLAVITMTTGYSLIAANRAVQLRGRRPRAFDILFALGGLGACAAYLMFAAGLQTQWAPSVIMAMLSSLAAMAAWDLLRVVLPASWLAAIWVPEHIYKILFSWGGLVCAAAGNLLPQLGPAAQLGPTILSCILIPLFWWRHGSGRKLVKTRTA